jgi:hypothetical protein
MLKWVTDEVVGYSSFLLGCGACGWSIPLCACARRCANRLCSSLRLPDSELKKKPLRTMTTENMIFTLATLPSFVRTQNEFPMPTDCRSRFASCREAIAFKQPGRSAEAVGANRALSTAPTALR